MDIESYPADKRVFHIDDECYIVYLGSDREDYKPFLRIGNSKALNQKIISNTYNIVVTDSYTGNPALEPENINTEKIQENRYVGDRETIRRFLNFLKNYNKETSKITQYQDMKVKERGALVSFLDNGNMQLTCDRRLLFDLKSRERRDLHYIEKTKWIMDQFSRNSLRYRPADFRFPGFLLLQGSVLVFNRDKLIAFHLPEDYFVVLVQQGIDPDLISALITEDVSESVVQLLKRKQYKKEKIDVLSMNTTLLGSALELFEASGLKSQLHDLRKGRVKGILDYSLSVKESRLEFSHKEIPYPLCISEELSHGDNPQLNLNPAKMTLTLTKSIKKIASGIPHVFTGEEPVRSKITESYFSQLLGFFSELLNPSELIMAKNLESFLKDIESDTKFQSNFKNVKGGLRKLKPRSIKSIYFLLNNACGICDLLIEEKANNSDVNRALTNIRGSLNRILFASGPIDINLPLVCSVHVKDKTLLPMFELMRDTVSRDEYALSQDINMGIDDKVKENIEFFQQERERLDALIDELGLPAPQKVKSVPVEEKPGVEEGVTERAKREAREKKKTHLRWIFIPIGVVVVAVAALLLLRIPERLQGKKPSAMEGEEIAHEEEPVTETKVEPETSIQEREVTPLPSSIQITILDIYLMTNKIARENGFRELDSPAELGRDPDWIYPDNVFTLPDKTSYTVVDGDTIWYIAHSYIKKTLRQDWERYTAVLKELDEKGDVLNNKEKYISELEDIKNGSYSENFKKEVERTLTRLR